MMWWLFFLTYLVVFWVMAFGCWALVEDPKTAPLLRRASIVLLVVSAINLLAGLALLVQG